MPGGRLTREDRRDIAAGLAEGLGYAEIARRLGRPTSTVSREVSRNGGPRDYRPDHAHQATERRARRRGPARFAAETAGGAAHGRDPEAMRALEELFAEVLVGSGITRTPARVLTCLSLTDSGTLTAAELVEALRVSPASISKAVGYLEEQGLIRRERDPRGRRERYVIDGDIWFEAFLSSARTNATLAAAARQGVETLGRATPAGGRLEGMAEFLERTSRDMLDVALRWRHVLRDRERDDSPEGGSPGGR
ncbi:MULTISPECIES: MarR family transcriptional regulator [unclassified Nonomuraea]|uniref:GbsR/MarR family transcriptional regulator n=1 Tax=unclassified Nonomuraea TaxID=2593643 RepID=UPI0033D2CD83